MGSRQNVIAGEVWRPVVGYEAIYAVSNYGKVKRIRRGKKGARVGRELHPCLDSGGYASLRLCGEEGGDGKTFRMHELVSAAFLGKRPPGYHTNHIDAIKAHNFAWNLEYITPKENAVHAARNGLVTNGEKQWSALLTAKDVRWIRKQVGRMKQCEMAAKLGVAYQTVWDVAHGRTWKHVS